MDLDLWDCFGRKKTYLKANLHTTDFHISGMFGQRKLSYSRINNIVIKVNGCTFREGSPVIFQFGLFNRGQILKDKNAPLGANPSYLDLTIF